MRNIGITLYNLSLVALSGYVYTQSHSIWLCILVLIFTAHWGKE